MVPSHFIFTQLFVSKPSTRLNNAKNIFFLNFASFLLIFYKLIESLNTKSLICLLFAINGFKNSTNEVLVSTLQITNHYIKKSNIGILYQNNSIEKSTKQKVFAKDYQKRINEKITQLAQQSKIASKAKLLSDLVDKSESITNYCKTVFFAKGAVLVNSAIKIQKLFRGYKARLKNDQQFIESKENELAFLTKDLENISYNCYFHLGTNTITVT